MANNKIVLIIDSDDRSARAAKDALTGMCDNEIKIVGSLSKAKPILENESVVFIVINFAFGDQENLDLIKSIRKNNPNYAMPILAFIEENHSETLINDVRNAGVTDFLIKPFNITTLENTIISIINNPRNFIVTEGYIGPDRRKSTAQPKKGQSNRKYDK